MSADKKLIVKCKQCGRDNTFDQPYAYHAGFSDQGFMYSDSGHLTLTWSWYDPAIKRFFSDERVWTAQSESHRRFEAALLPAPDGGRWRFSNPARCLHCSAALSGPMMECVYYLLYPGSIQTEDGRGDMRLAENLTGTG